MRITTSNIAESATPSEIRQLRDDTLYDHPLTKDVVVVPTNAIQEAFSVVQDALLRYESGVCFLGESRFGKTSAIRAINAAINQNFESVPRILFNAKEHDHATERALYTDMLVDLNYREADRGTAVARRIRLFTLLLDAAQCKRSDRILMLIDEAQNLRRDDFTHLRDLSNDLARHGVKLVTVLFAHPMLNQLRNELVGEGRTDLIGRFLLKPYAFHGIRSSADLADTLNCYDDPNTFSYPPSSRICISSFFLPEAFAGGWRLKGEAKVCWDEFVKVRGHRVDDDGDIGMNWIGRAISDFLSSNIEGDSPHFSSDRSSWAMSIARSKYAATMSNYGVAR
ncbi:MULTISPECIES: ATP-binding protein [Pandoraea]|uniref:ATP-binding protein n=3 Tax=Pandoraea TaxID=93217 RepID=A0A5E4VL06_9BURK|nr:MULTISPECIES: ATP-binding protein [Pandoraea]RRJ24979.1 ATP-binding protein [Pandoraea apista]RRJ72054.1 ATP-binding protein [Pandoraea apista]RSC95516.1 ATP-binding protein [Pandoraea apista]RSD07107.1 ATP-binding protein [Pandoraea apista]RSK73704.1 ATP-binding protein [Pandoraea apista]